jgi:hypothetical protein
MLRLRIVLPDQPGSLARVTWTLGVLGADIVQISVLERDGGRALDDITLESRGQPRDRLLSALRSTPGVRPIAVWTDRTTSEALPDVDVVTAMIAAPRRAVTTLMDATPILLAADWACVADGDGVVLLASAGARRGAAMPPGIPPRAVGTETAQSQVVRAPIPGAYVLAVVRDEGPPFHRTEINRLRRLLEVLDGLGVAESDVLELAR